MSSLAATTKGHLFEDQAAAYASYRPTYPDSMYDAIYSRMGPGRTLALDVGCGTGQATTRLANDFQQVLGLDSSAGQLAQAVPHPRVRYSQAPAEDLRAAEPGSVDLLTVAQAYHWFDHPKFLREARRVLKPQVGSLALLSYACHELMAAGGSEKGSVYSAEQAATANTINRELYAGTLGPYWDARRNLVDEEYRGLEPGPEHFGQVERVEGLAITRTWSLDQFLGYLESWSGLQTYRKRHPTLPDPLLAFRQNVKKALDIQDDAQPGTVHIRWPLCLVVAKDPRPL
ncbi:hypothetical protein H632_c1735p0 [Helicosporidium sp. ATCC 50920]|nr:hypothetical protein H632_c1735p0 [Helicosporidium sp. ATCC 50920]|eukprot:KDD73914.1 hypothetical protein H632_c1735p0 [Helicosporidium sp. ATCC 50920]